ncbi:MAG: glycosyl hydrolase, partial [Nitrospirae bacterium]|nr:glycosyl hydrolase [Fimbriimonadaceae bacterium]
AGARPIPAPPGEYRVVMTADGDVQVETFRLRNSPNSSATEADTVAQFLFARRISQRTNDANGAVVKIRGIKRSIASAIEKHGDLKAKGEVLAAKLSAIEEEIYQVRNQSGQDPLNYPIRLNNKIAALLGVVLQGDFRPTDQAYEVFAMLDQQLSVQLAALDELLAHAGAEFNAELKSRGLPPLGDNAGNVGG